MARARHAERALGGLPLHHAAAAPRSTHAAPRSTPPGAPHSPPACSMRFKNGSRGAVSVLQHAFDRAGAAVSQLHRAILRCGSRRKGKRVLRWSFRTQSGNAIFERSLAIPDLSEERCRLRSGSWPRSCLCTSASAGKGRGAGGAGTFGEEGARKARCNCFRFTNPRTRCTCYEPRHFLRILKYTR